MDNAAITESTGGEIKNRETGFSERVNTARQNVPSALIPVLPLTGRVAMELVEATSVALVVSRTTSSIPVATLASTGRRSRGRRPRILNQRGLVPPRLTVPEEALEYGTQ